MTGTALAFTGEKLLPQAKVTLPQARKVALNAYPGKSGRSGLRYSFVIDHKKVKHEVGVDAKPARCWKNAIEGKNPD